MIVHLHDIITNTHKQKSQTHTHAYIYIGHDKKICFVIIILYELKVMFHSFVS